VSAGRIRHVPRARQSGLGLIELMVVVLISLIMMAGLLALVFGSRQNFTAQFQMAQLQDNERLAMTLVTNVLQTGGYFYDPALQKPAAAFPASTANGTNFAGGQYVYGTGNYTGNDQIYVRYYVGPNNGSASSDGTMDCTGATNPSTSAPLMDVNYFYINAATNQLMCQVNGGTAQPLVSGVTAMNILYGVATAGTTSAVQYVTAAALNGPSPPATWTQVVSAQVKLTFTTVATSAGANIMPMTVTLTRTIDLLNRV
jgi:type IV pilus assembly protein PilW